MSDPVLRIYNYDDVPTVRKFAQDNTFVRCLIGPFRSGKSSGCAMEIMQRAMAQPPNTHHKRRSRWAAVRNTYGSLEDTTMKTFFEWFPDGTCGRYTGDDHTFKIRRNLDDGTQLELDILFRALDRPEHIAKLKSWELTGAWLNEVVEIPQDIFDTIQSRVGQFPPRWDVKDYWCGIIADTNPCDTDHWFYRFFEEEIPQSPEMSERFKIFHQPSGLSEEAENLPNLQPRYYQNECIGKDSEWIKVYMHGEYGYVQTGKPVYPNYRDSIHVAKEVIKPIPGSPLIMGIDAGTTPACIITQLTPWGSWQILEEFCTSGSYLEELLTVAVKPVLLTKYMGHPITIITDMAKKAETDGRTIHDSVRNILKIIPRNTPTNSPDPRIQAVDKWLRKTIKGKEPAFQLSPNCIVLRRGFNGGYRYRRMQLVGQERFIDRPEKTHPVSDAHDALQYAALFTEHGIEIVTQEHRQRYNPVMPVIPAAAWT